MKNQASSTSSSHHILIREYKNNQMAKKSEPRGQRGARPSRGARPRNAENAGAKVSFRHRNAEFVSWLHTVLHSRTAGELT